MSISHQFPARSLKLGSSAECLSVPYQLDRLSHKVTEYTESVSLAIKGVEQSILNEVPHTNPEERPSSPPILRVEKANLLILPEGQHLIEEIEKIHTFFVFVGLISQQESNNPFTQMKNTVHNSSSTLQTTISNYRSKQAPPVSLSEKIPIIGSGYSTEAYRNQIYRALVPVPPEAYDPWPESPRSEQSKNSPQIPANEETE